MKWSDLRLIVSLGLLCLRVAEWEKKSREGDDLFDYTPEVAAVLMMTRT